MRPEISLAEPAGYHYRQMALTACCLPPLMMHWWKDIRFWVLPLFQLFLFGFTTKEIGKYFESQTENLWMLCRSTNHKYIDSGKIQTEICYNYKDTNTSKKFYLNVLTRRMLKPVALKLVVGDTNRHSHNHFQELQEHLAYLTPLAVKRRLQSLLRRTLFNSDYRI